MRLCPLVLATVSVGCGPRVPAAAGATTGGSPPPTTTASENGDDDDDADDADTVISDYDIGGGPQPESCGDADHPCPLDVLVVIDNSSAMADPQLALTRALVQLVGRLEAHDGSTSAIVDVQMMFTTTDMGNPLCEPFQNPPYTPAMGAPTTTGCNERIGDFVEVGSDPLIRYDACTNLCPLDVEPTDPFVAFLRDQSNVPDGPVVDVNGDGVMDSRAAQAVACLAPQGIGGCGYEQPLEAMLRALDPAAAWNVGDRPFLRPGSIVLVVLATDETDCSMADFSLMQDQAYMEVDPASGVRGPSSALCWNAGVTCDGPDVDGVQHDCMSNDGPLLPVSRYTDRLLGELRELEGRDVLMVAITGVPIVTSVNRSPPFEPTVGGIHDLVIHEWRDGLYPVGDLLPDDADPGIDDKQFEFGIGPGCTELDETSGIAVQAIPSPRVHEVCSSLDLDNPSPSVRCCVESVCDPSPALACIDGWLTPIVDLLPPDG